MTLSVQLLMRIYQGASLSWHWSAGALATAASGSYCAVKGFMLITSACTAFII
ncbi:lipoprotein [Serratia plymuthica]|nr:lipoprotein [Serratia plymuthica]